MQASSLERPSVIPSVEGLYRDLSREELPSAAIRSVVVAQLADIRRRAQERPLGVLGDPYLIQPLSGRLHELREIRLLCGLNRGLGDLRAEINQLMGTHIHEIDNTINYCLPNMALTEIQDMTQWGLSQGAKDCLLRIAVAHNMPLPIIQHLVGCGANVHRHINSSRWTILMAAAMNADQATVDYFLSLGLNPRARDSQGKTAHSLMLAVRDPALPHLRNQTFFPYDNEHRVFYFLSLRAQCA